MGMFIEMKITGVVIIAISLLIAGCGLSQLKGGSYSRNIYTPPNSIVVNLRYLDTWANFRSVDFMLVVGDDTFEIKIFRKGKKIAECFGDKEQATQIVDFLSNWIDD